MQGIYVNRLVSVQDSKVQATDSQLTEKPYEFLRPYLRTIHTYNFAEYAQDVENAKQAFIQCYHNVLTEADGADAQGQADDNQIALRIKAIYLDSIHSIDPMTGKQNTVSEHHARIVAGRSKAARITIASDLIFSFFEEGIDPELLEQLNIGVIPRLIQTYLNQPFLVNDLTKENVLLTIGMKSDDGVTPIYFEPLFKMIKHLDELFTTRTELRPYLSTGGGYELVFTGLTVVAPDNAAPTVVMAFTHVGNLFPDLNEETRMELTTEDINALATPDMEPVPTALMSKLQRYITELQLMFLPEDDEALHAAFDKQLDVTVANSDVHPA